MLRGLPAGRKSRRSRRGDGKGTVVGYFYGPKRSEVPGETELENLTPDEAISIHRFGDLSLIEGE